MEQIQTPLSGNINSTVFKALVRKGAIRWAGNRKLKIYGKLRCLSGKRMKQGNRVFFSSEAEALHHGYRPCAHCLREKYGAWCREVS